MLQNAYFLAKIGADTAENEQHFAEILPKIERPLPHGPHSGRGVPARGCGGEGALQRLQLRRHALLRFSFSISTIRLSLCTEDALSVLEIRFYRY